MPAIVEELRRGHCNFENLLKVLEEEVSVFERSERPDYEVMESIVRYFEDYAEDRHHLAENLILEKLTLRDQVAARAVGDLEAEHHELKRRVRELATVIEEVLGEQDFRREMLGNAARSFAECERRHMKKEEETLLVPACNALTGEDWREIEHKAFAARDPLSARRTEQKFAALTRRIMKWEREDQADRALASRIRSPEAPQG